MADLKITQLTELTTPALDDLLAAVDDPSGTPETKKVTLQKIKDLIATDTRIATVIVAADGSGDYTTIQDGINALPAAGGLVFVKNGTYEISATITIAKSNVALIGQGEATIIRLANGANVNAITIGDAVSSYSNILIQNLKVDGNGTQQTSNGRAIDILGLVTNIKILGVHFINNYGYSISSNQDGEGLLIQDCLFDNLGGQLYVDYANNFSLINCRFNSNKMAALWLYNSKNVFLYGNYFKTTLNPGFSDANVFISTCERINVVGNTFEANPQGNLWLYVSKYISVVGNTFLDSPSDNVRISQCFYGVVSGNDIYKAIRGISIFDSAGFSISGNTILTNQWGGIYIYACSQITVQGNMLQDSGIQANNQYDAIGLEGFCTRIAIVGNTIYETAANKVKYGIAEKNFPSDYNLIGHNIVRGPVTKSVYGIGPNSIFDSNIL
jgi:parallel beta-helix repeat protein